MKSTCWYGRIPGFDDAQEVAAEIKRLIKMDVRVAIILPPAYICGSCLEMAERYRCPIFDLDADKMERFVEAVAGSL